jgi:peptide subunit release factor 1 (eRF1)
MAVAMATEPVTRTRLRRLAEVRPERGRVLSVFVNLDPAELPTPPARATAISSILTEAAHRVEKVEAPHDEREDLKHDLRRVEDVLRAGGIAADGTHGVALYVCRSADLLELIRLPHPVRSQVVVDRSPFVEPLVREADGERWSVLLANRRAARIFSGPPERLKETDRLEDNVHRQHDQGGWSQANYQRSVEKDKDDHVAHTVEVLFAAHKAHPIDRLLLGAPPELVANYEHRLHPYLRERLVGRLHLDVEQANVDEVRRQAVEAATEWTRRCEREALDRLAEGVGRGGRGAAGLHAVLDALNGARVELLLVQPGLREAGFRDPEHDLLFATEASAPDGRALEPVEDVVEAALAKAIEQAAGVRVVRHHDDLGPLGGIGAVLRF